MPIAGLFYVVGAVVVLLIVPVLALAATWKRMEPGARRALLAVYVTVLVLIALIALGIRHWASSGPLD